MSLDPARLEAAIRQNEVTAVRKLLRHATEPDRRACARALRPLLHGPDFSQLGVPFTGPELIRLEGLPGLVSFVLERVLGDQRGERDQAADRTRSEWNATRNSAAFLAATLGLAGTVATAHIAADRCDPWRQPNATELAVIAGVLADRRPPWLAELVNRKLRDDWDSGLSSWALARALIRLGAIERPEVPQYITRMPSALCRSDRGRNSAVPHGWRMARHPLNALLADPDLLEDEVWQLFTVPDAAAALTACDGRWEDTLATLSERGTLDRGRLLDACLDAFTMDFAPNGVGWYVTFHDRMNPSPDEMAARSGRYLKLLATRARPGVMLGQQACGQLLEAGLLAAGDFLAASGPALLFPVKSIAAAQLKLVGQVAATPLPAGARTRARALATAAVAFGHDQLGIQEAALKLIGRHGLPDGAEGQVISELAASLAPGLGREAAALGLRARTYALYVPVPRPPQAGPAAGSALPPPLDDPDELVQLLTQLMEDASDVLAVERALAGAVRLCARPAAERARLAAPLLVRAGQRLEDDYDGPFGGREIAADIAGLTLAWGAGRMPEPRSVRPWGSQDRETVLRSGRARTMAGILTARIREASELAASGRPVQLLAEPESERGAISADRLLDRLASWTNGRGRAQADLPRHDLEIALLRLAPGMGEEFWSAWSARHPSSLPAARRAYQDGLAPLSFESQVGLPGGHQSAYGPVGPDPVVVARITDPPAASRSRCWELLTALTHPLRDFYRDYGERWYVSSSYQAVVAQWPLLCPWQPELAAANLLRPLSESLTSGPTWAATAATAVGGLSPSGHALGEIGHLALLTGLASAEPYVRIAAAEVWARASHDGRLDPGLAADALVTGVTGRAFKLNRIADGLEHASHEAIAGQRIVETVFAAADRLVPAKPANLHLLIELAARIGADSGMPAPPGAITRIAAAKGSTRLAAAARQISPRP
jgi:Family of unknown function (DUF6493)